MMRHTTNKAKRATIIGSTSSRRGSLGSLISKKQKISRAYQKRKQQHSFLYSTTGNLVSVEKLEHNKQHNGKVLLKSFHLNGHFWISPTDSKVRATLYDIINRTTGKYCSVAFIKMVTI